MRNKQRVATMGLAVVASVAVLGGAFLMSPNKN